MLSSTWLATAATATTRWINPSSLSLTCTRSSRRPRAFLTSTAPTPSSPASATRHTWPLSRTWSWRSTRRSSANPPSLTSTLMTTSGSTPSGRVRPLLASFPSANPPVSMRMSSRTSVRLSSSLLRDSLPTVPSRSSSRTSLRWSAPVRTLTGDVLSSSLMVPSFLRASTSASVARTPSVVPFPTVMPCSTTRTSRTALGLV
mmetsp:Transcript_20594/g.40461  ORF Transcript_20594/g.40461 Transcript_20594/m.40461 type:complete len:202 (-) Transcript_20594:1275-1880(-)